MENWRPKKWLDSFEKQKRRIDFCEKVAQICQIFVAMATRVGPQHCTWFCWIGHHRKPPSRRKHLRSICHTSRVIGDFVSHFGESILGVMGPKSKIEVQCFVECHTENWQPNNGATLSRNKKEESIWRSVTNIGLQTESTTKIILPARRGDKKKQRSEKQALTLYTRRSLTCMSCCARCHLTWLMRWMICCSRKPSSPTVMPMSAMTTQRSQSSRAGWRLSHCW